jgi:hypothetical protein
MKESYTYRNMAGTTNKNEKIIPAIFLFLKRNPYYGGCIFSFSVATIRIPVQHLPRQRKKEPYEGAGATVAVVAVKEKNGQMKRP